MKHYLVLSCAIALTACQPQTDDLDVFVQTVSANTQVNIEPYPEFTSQPAFEYTADNTRSPFAKPMSAAIEPIEKPQQNCQQPNFKRTKQPLEKYGLDALNLTGTFTSQGKKWALFKTNDGSLHKATYGNYIGLFFGKITSINNTSVSFTEMLPDGAGCYQQKQATLTMTSAAGENDNV